MTEYELIRSGAIELPLQTASKVDPNDQALDYMRDGMRQGDRRKELYDAREECYKVVTQALGELDSKMSQAAASSDSKFYLRYFVPKPCADSQAVLLPEDVTKRTPWPSTRTMSCSIVTYTIGMSTEVLLNSSWR